MKPSFPRFLSLGAAAVVGACTTAPAQEAHDPKAATELAEALQGRTAGKPVSCIRNYQSTNMQVIDDWTILFREGRTVYVQHPRGGCYGLGSGARTLVTRQFGVNQLCSGDINQLVDLRTGMGGSPCVFSEFVPYTRPAG